MKPLSDFDPRRAAQVSHLLCDIDDTLTTEGKLLPEVYAALWNLRHAGVQIVPITGRPAGWCDMIVRQWPVQAVVGENGAFVYEPTAESVRVWTHPSVQKNTSNRLAALIDEVVRAVPTIRLAKDQAYRLYDVAFDFAEDDPRLPFPVAEHVRDLCVKAGAQARISSIHVNAWFGAYSKRDMTVRFLKEREGIDGVDGFSGVLFVGDSPNDAPMFEEFALSVAVANYRNLAHLSEAHPAYVTDGANGAGFVEVAELLLEARALA